VVVEEKVHKRYPSCDSTTRVAKCVYCEKVKDKADMMCIGQNHHEKGSLRYVWRCAAKLDGKGRTIKQGCEAGSPSWLKHYAHKTPFGKLWNYNLDTGKIIRHSEEEEKAVGRQIVEKRSEQINEAISKALSKGLEKENKKRPGNPLVEQTLVALKKGAERHGAKNVRVELKAKVGRRTVVVARAEESDARERVRGDEMRSRAAADVPRWKRKGRTAKLRRK
jgi:hypothetical protein